MSYEFNVEVIIYDFEIVCYSMSVKILVASLVVIPYSLCPKGYSHTGLVVVQHFQCHEKKNSITRISYTL